MDNYLLSTRDKLQIKNIDKEIEPLLYCLRNFTAKVFSLYEGGKCAEHYAPSLLFITQMILKDHITRC